MIQKSLNVIVAVLVMACVGARADEAMLSYFATDGGYGVVAGWTFQPVTNISVTSLGCFDELFSDNDGSIEVGLWAPDGTLLASNVISSNSPLVNQSRYEPITPVTLRASLTYTIAAYSTNGLLILLAEAPADGGSAIMSSGIQLGTAAFSTNGYSSGLIFPYGLQGGPGAAAITANFQYTAAPPVHGVQFSSLVSFAGTNGAYPNTSLTQGNDGNLYGTTLFGGSAGYGNVFTVTTNGLLTSVHTFGIVDDTNGAEPDGSLTLGSDGNFYGTTLWTGRTGGTGTMFSMHKVMKTNESVTTLFRFEPEYFVGGEASYTNSGGGHPASRLTIGSDGNFYGSTQTDGTNGSGTIFVTTTAGQLTSLVSFDAAFDDGTGTFTVTNVFGLYPGDLTLGPGGIFYGAASSAGQGGVGTIFSVTTNGQLTSLFSFDRAVYDDTVGVYSNAFGAYPNNRLTFGNDGCLYGTTSDGGSNSVGTVFKVTTNGVMTTLFAFGGGGFNQSTIYTNEDGAFPSAGVTLGPDGDFYGTTKSGGAAGVGTVFKITTNGVLTTLVTFNGPNGSQPLAPLTLAIDGNLYGTTSSGGTYGSGTVFELAFGLESIPLWISADANNQVVLTWTNAAFGLQCAPDLKSTFTNVPGAASPYTNIISGPQQYFRLISN